MRISSGLVAEPTATSPSSAAARDQWQVIDSAATRELGAASTCDLGRVVDKYIGETEKHLDAVFGAASSPGNALLFDEADALFGQRGAVRDSHDRYAGLEVGYLLQRSEARDSLLLLASQVKEPIDPDIWKRAEAVVTIPGPPR